MTIGCLQEFDGVWEVASDGGSTYEDGRRGCATGPKYVLGKHYSVVWSGEPDRAQYLARDTVNFLDNAVEQGESPEPWDLYSRLLVAVNRISQNGDADVLLMVFGNGIRQFPQVALFHPNGIDTDPPRPWAVGSGSLVAKGAMLAGASVREAVGHACGVFWNCNLPVHSARWAPKTIGAN